MRREIALIAAAVGLALVSSILSGCYTINVRCPPDEEIRRPQAVSAHRDG